ncbi:MAG: hypothetical protein FWD78_08055 [Treponema sp.]|nr:hypothetical protein [Treponema sp.]
MDHFRYSGIYPHLAVTNEGHSECGIGTVVYWAEKLWFITYPSSGYKGDDNKLWSIDKNLNMIAHPKSVGGTHANRMIHKESNQLIIGPYFIDSRGNVRALDPAKIHGRFTGAGRHLKDPANLIYLNTMEGGLYEVNVNTLEFTELRRDMTEICLNPDILQNSEINLPGTHGKGGYTAQGRFYFTNNGSSGVLAEWDGLNNAQMKSSWKIVDLQRYTEVTSPGGLTGENKETDPVWSLGWDDKSPFINLRQNNTWHRYRLPKGSYTQDADHGWFTEWPRIRFLQGFGNLMCEHGLLYKFPDNFSLGNTGGICPISMHLKMIADWDNFNNEFIFACDDASMFDNAILGRQQSNVWFATADDLKKLGRPSGWCGIYLNETLEGGIPSEPVLFTGFDHHVLHIQSGHFTKTKFIIEADKDGSGKWENIAELTVPPYGYIHHCFDPSVKAEWIRLRPYGDFIKMRASMDYLPAIRPAADKSLVEGISVKSDSSTPAMLHVAEDESMKLHLVKNGKVFEIDSSLELHKIDDTALLKHVENSARIKNIINVDDKSVYIPGPDGTSFRLPKADSSWAAPYGRTIREVVTERELINICGTIFELPRHESGGFRRIKPVTSHNLYIEDFASWRGMLVLAGVTGSGKHCILSKNNEAGIWLGNVDDLWNFGPPRGIGGPCKNTPMKAKIPGDPYLMAGYLNKSVIFSHDSSEEVEFTLLVDFMADDKWSVYNHIMVPAGKTIQYKFPDGYSAHWIKITVSKDCSTTAIFTYE